MYGERNGEFLKKNFYLNRIHSDDQPRINNIKNRKAKSTKTRERPVVEHQQRKMKVDEGP
ncbi:MAG TPA: hypothetical protein DCF33_14690 [Saprospirales bacterium]|nr:hypothetical protein [Saprospirales bacterium]